VLSMEVPSAARPVPLDPRVSVPVLLPCVRVALEGEALGAWDVAVTADCPAVEESAGRLVSFFGMGRRDGAGAPPVPGTALMIPTSVAAFSVGWRWMRL
jgi:hypothetical protein